METTSSSEPKSTIGQWNQRTNNPTPSGNPMPSIGKPLPLNFFDGRNEENHSDKQDDENPTNNENPVGALNSTKKEARNAQFNQEKESERKQDEASPEQEESGEGKDVATKDGKKEGKEEEKNTFQKKAQTLTKKILFWAWLNAIPSYGITLIYVWFHFLARYVAGSKLFSRFGSLLYKEKKSEKGETQRDPTDEYTEIILAGGLLLLFCLGILLFLIMIGTLTWAVVNPGKVLWGAFKTAVKTMVNNAIGTK